MKYKRTIATAVAICSGVCALGSVVTGAESANPERCTKSVAKGTTCGTAYKVLDRSMANDGLEYRND